MFFACLSGSVANYRKQESLSSQAIDFSRYGFRIFPQQGNFATEPSAPPVTACFKTLPAVKRTTRRAGIAAGDTLGHLHFLHATTLLVTNGRGVRRVLRPATGHALLRRPDPAGGVLLRPPWRGVNHPQRGSVKRRSGIPGMRQPSLVVIPLGNGRFCETQSTMAARRYA